MEPTNRSQHVNYEPEQHTINVAMGLFLMGLFVFTENNPPIVPMLAVGLTIQSGYTLWFMTRRAKGLEPSSLRVLLAGQTLAALVGGYGFVITTVNNLLRPPPGADPEYGPIAVGASSPPKQSRPFTCTW